ncbi:hypothetical protein V5799_032272 [Amblyomma americanum]|uniref:Transmembrane protein n=2 Tax=Amblyomma americanum TaxID=6943 RepID=A0AAQ4DRM9_AMBAM
MVQMSKDEDESKEDKEEDNGEEKKDEEHKEEEDEEEEDAGGDKDGALGKNKKPPDSMMVQRKSASRSGTAGLTTQQSVADAGAHAQVLMTIAGLATFVVVVVAFVAFVVYKIVVAPTPELTTTTTAATPAGNGSGGLVALEDIDMESAFKKGSGLPSASIVFAEAAEDAEEVQAFIAWYDLGWYVGLTFLKVYVCFARVRSE